MDNSKVYLGGVRVSRQIDDGIRNIASRRNEIVSLTIEKALSRYIAEDERLRRRSRGKQH